MLEKEENVKAAFINSLTEKPKLIEFVCVDGAMDERLSHMEVQFWWTIRHYERPTVATL